MMMMSPKITICFLIFAVCFVSAQNKQTENDPKFDARVSDVLANNVLQLSQEIGTTVLQDSDKSTEVFSPLSIYTALSMILMGANGRTFQELTNLLKINNDSYLINNSWKVHEEFGLMLEDLALESPNPLHNRPQHFWQTHRRPMVSNHINRNRDPRSLQRISVANGIFLQNGYSIRPDYRDAIQSTYKSTLQQLDFLNNADLSTKFINRWVNDKTEGKIKELFSSALHPETKIVIASALYFKAMWERTFFEGSTRPMDFYPDGFDKPAIKVDMMAQGGALPFAESKEHDCRIIGLPYRRNLTTMYVILPNNSNRQRLRQLQATLTADKINDLISKMEWKTSIFLFPKLHLTNQMNLRSILGRMGLRTLFRNDQSDLSLLSSGEQEFGSSHLQRHPSIDQTNDRPFLFSRFGESGTNLATKRTKRSAVTYKTSSSDFHSVKEPLRLKDLVIGKRITKSYPRKKTVSRHRREVSPDSSISLKRLDALRTQSNIRNPNLFADELVHHVDLTINEYGTEGGAATATYLRRTGPDVFFRTEAPFLFLIRHDHTKLPLFYGAVFEPTNN